MNKLLIYFFVLVFLSACESTPTKNPTPTKNSTPNSSELMNLSFVDLEDFDKTLSESMSANLNTIKVKMIGPVSINHIPERLGKWLSVVREKNGRVDLTPKNKSNGDNEIGMSKFPVLLILAALPSTYKFLKTENLYGIAANYNVSILYNPDNGQIERLIFHRKAE